MILDDPRHDDLNIIQGKILSLFQHRKIICDFRDEAYHNAARVFEALKPLSIVGKRKIRVGGWHDGSYVMLEPPDNTRKKIAYSFGISTHAQWDLEMARQGYEIIQYDGSVERSPDKHPLIKFHKINITGDDSPSKNETNIAKIISGYGHHDCWNIILKMDIEGAEWNVLERISENDISHFEQILVEWHGFPTDDRLELERRLGLLGKLNRTHQSIHIHAPNGVSPTVLQDLRLLPQLFEVAYVRRRHPITAENEYQFQECTESFPGDLDTPLDLFGSNLFLGSYVHQGFPKRTRLGEKEALAFLRMFSKKRVPWWLINAVTMFIPMKKYRRRYRRLLRAHWARSKMILLPLKSIHR